MRRHRNFAAAALVQSVPSGLWGGSLTPAPNDPSLISDALLGVTLTPAAAPAPGTATAIPVTVLQSEIQSQPAAFAWGGVGVPAVVTESDSVRRGEIVTAVTAAAATQAELIAALGIPITVDCAATVADASWSRRKSLYRPVDAGLNSLRRRFVAGYHHDDRCGPIPSPAQSSPVKTSPGFSRAATA